MLKRLGKLTSTFFVTGFLMTGISVYEKTDLRPANTQVELYRDRYWLIPKKLLQQLLQYFYSKIVRSYDNG